SRALRLVMALAIVIAVACGTFSRPAAAKDELVIGITQFPSSLHPGFDPLLAKTYVLAMTRRPFTAYDQSWKLVCLLCTELPTIADGGAKLTGNGGIAVTYTIHLDATW